MDLTGEDLAYLGLAFFVFTVSFAVIRNLFGRMWGRIPEKERNNWKKSFKRRLGSNDNHNQPNMNSDPNAGNSAFGGNNDGPNNHYPEAQGNGNGGNPYDYQSLGDPPADENKGEAKPGMFGRFFGGKKNA